MKRGRGKIPPTPEDLKPFWNAQIHDVAGTLWQPRDMATRPIPGYSGWATFAEHSGDGRMHEINFDRTPEAIERQRKKRRAVVQGPQLPATTCVVTRKYRLIVDASQRAILKQWVEATRWTYNQTVEWINAAKPTDKAGRQAMNESFVKNVAFPVDAWQLGTPMVIRRRGFMDAMDAYDACRKKKRLDATAAFKMHFRTKKAAAESIYLSHDSISIVDGKVGFFPTFLPGHMMARPSLPHSIDKDCRLQRTALGAFFLCVPMDVPLGVRAGENQARPHVIALDPGVRVFQTGYDPEGKLYEFGKGDMHRIERLAEHLDVLQGKIAQPTVRAKQRLRLRRAAMRLRQRIRNLVDDVQKKASGFLATHYDLVLLPKFETSRMVERTPKRRINSKTARGMLTWAHFRFQQRLTHRAQRTGTQIKIVSEAYTSKTCGSCGVLHPTLGGAKVFRCPNCGHTIDRDANAARNILLRNGASINLDMLIATRPGPARPLFPGTSAPGQVHGGTVG